jgi:hypothetical protein
VALSAINLPPFSHWVTDNATYIRDDAYLTRYGLYLGRTTAPDTDIAVVTAGALAYWSHRPTVDLLGKSDEVIARGPERKRFHPGHGKWDYSYSIGRLRPAVIAQIWRFSPEDERYIARLGYRRRSHAGAPAPPTGTSSVPTGVICCGWERP